MLGNEGCFTSFGSRLNIVSEQRHHGGDIMAYLTLTPEDLKDEHICCAISDKKCSQGYGLKKLWLSEQFGKGYRFTRLDQRAKVFLEYGPAEEAWIPVAAPDYLMLGCYWVSGQYKGKGHAKALLSLAKEAAIQGGKRGLAAVVGQKKYHFMSDAKFLLKQGFRQVDQSPDGFALLALDLREPPSGGPEPQFLPQVKAGGCAEKTGLMVYYSDRCPFTDFYIREVLPITAKNQGLALSIHKIQSREEAQASPTPATIFSLYYQGQFVTTDLGACLENRFVKIMAKAGFSL
jgi:GNAT superfamily N-acetyltransferase